MLAAVPIHIYQEKLLFWLKEIPKRVAIYAVSGALIFMILGAGITKTHNDHAKKRGQLATFINGSTVATTRANARLALKLRAAGLLTRQLDSMQGELKQASKDGATLKPDTRRFSLGDWAEFVLLGAGIGAAIYLLVLGIGVTKGLWRRRHADASKAPSS